MPSTINPREYLEAAKDGNLIKIMQYLQEHKKSEAYLNILSGPEYLDLKNTTALVFAAHYNQPIIVKHLLAAGVRQKCQALFNAAAKGNLEVVKMLLERIWDPEKLSRTYTHGYFDAEKIAQIRSHYECATLIRVRKKELESWRFRIRLFNKLPIGPALDSVPVSTPLLAPVNVASPPLPPVSAPDFVPQDTIMAPPPPYISNRVKAEFEHKSFVENLPPYIPNRVEEKFEHKSVVENPHEQKVKQSSCGLFKTVLGRGGAALAVVAVAGICAMS